MCSTDHAEYPRKDLEYTPGRTPGDYAQWREQFVDRILELAKGEADILQITEWAIEAQQAKGDRDPVDVANEEFATGTPPIPT